MARKSVDLWTVNELDSAYKCEVAIFSLSQGVPVVLNHMIVMGQVGCEVCYKGD